MRSNATFTAATVIVLCAGATQAHARPGYRDRIPNGRSAQPGATNCQNCHIERDGGEGWNDFGNQIRGQGAGGPIWANLYNLDADGDGQTNGEELGDPCGTWMSGTAPRTTDISAPGDRNSTSADPRNPPCNPDAGVPDTGPGNPDTGVPDDTGVAPDTGVPDDTGVPPDTGAPEDTGVPPDTGVAPDTGVVPPDTGVVASDTGVQPADTGVTPVDVGSTPVDSGAPPPPGTSGGEEEDDGCNCATTDSGSPAWGLLLLGGLAVALRRRR